MWDKYDEIFWTRLLCSDNNWNYLLTGIFQPILLSFEFALFVTNRISRNIFLTSVFNFPNFSSARISKMSVHLSVCLFQFFGQTSQAWNFLSYFVLRPKIFWTASPTSCPACKLVIDSKMGVFKDSFNQVPLESS